VPVVGSFQSAVQFVAGANLALFALPNLRQPALEEETRKWVALTAAVRPSAEEWAQVRVSRLKFLDLQRDLYQKSAFAKTLSLWFAAVYAGLLIWTSAAAEVPTDGGFWVLVSVAGAIPAAVLVDLNAKSRMRLEKLRVERNEIERIVMSASP
jgi:hypothetical protein